MPPGPHDRLRLLAAWHAAREELNRVLEPLLAHGPVAVERVAARVGELRALLEAERIAFERFAAAPPSPDDDAGPEPSHLVPAAGRPVGVPHLLAVPRDPRPQR